MKQVRYGVAFIAAISAFTVGCVSTRTTQVDSRTSAWRGKSVVKSKLKADTDACIEEFKQVLNIPASAT